MINRINIFNFVDIAVTTSPSEDEEDNAEFYDAQELDTFTLNISGVSASNSRTRDRTDSQGSDDGSSSEGDPTPLPVSDSTGAEFLIVTDSTAAPISPITDNNVSKIHIFHSF